MWRGVWWREQGTTWRGNPGRRGAGRGGRREDEAEGSRASAWCVNGALPWHAPTPRAFSPSILNPFRELLYLAVLVTLGIDRIYQILQWHAASAQSHTHDGVGRVMGLPHAVDCGCAGVRGTAPAKNKVEERGAGVGRAR